VLAQGLEERRLLALGVSAASRSSVRSSTAAAHARSKARSGRLAV
jgi:hypothetical protein